MKKRVTEALLISGVVIPTLKSVWIEDSVTIGSGAFIGRNCRLSGETVIGAGAYIGDGAVISGAVIQSGDQVTEYAVIGVEDELKRYGHHGDMIMFRLLLQKLRVHLLQNMSG